jgi:hypothetical protein
MIQIKNKEFIRMTLAEYKEKLSAYPTKTKMHRAYNRLRLPLHPDKGGDGNFETVDRAYKEVLAENGWNIPAADAIESLCEWVGSEAIKELSTEVLKSELKQKIMDIKEQGAYETITKLLNGIQTYKHPKAELAYIVASVNHGGYSKVHISLALVFAIPAFIMAVVLPMTPLTSPGEWNYGRHKEVYGYEQIISFCVGIAGYSLGELFGEFNRKALSFKLLKELNSRKSMVQRRCGQLGINGAVGTLGLLEVILSGFPKLTNLNGFIGLEVLLAVQGLVLGFFNGRIMMGTASALEKAVRPKDVELREVRVSKHPVLTYGAAGEGRRAVGSPGAFIIFRESKEDGGLERGLLAHDHTLGALGVD